MFWGSAPRPPPPVGAHFALSALPTLVKWTINSSSTPLSQILATPLRSIMI